MTRREQFAMAAMQALISALISANTCLGEARVATRAVAYADALIAELGIKT